MYIGDRFIQQGWQCPICGRVYSPSTTMCYYCGSGQNYIYTNSTSNANIPDKETLDDWLKKFLYDSSAFRVKLDNEDKEKW